MPKRRNASCKASSSGTFFKSFLWMASTMWMTELARNTNTAESRIGSQSELSGTIDDLPGLGDLQLIHSTSTTSYGTRPVFRTASRAPSECHSKRAHRDRRGDAGAMRHGVASDQDLKDRPGVLVRLETPARRHDHAVHRDARVAQLQHMAGKRGRPAPVMPTLPPVRS